MSERLNLAVKELFVASKLEAEPGTIQRFARVVEGINAQGESVASITRGIVPSSYEGMAIKKDIPIYSYCAHHVLPWFGKVHMAYVAHGYILGVSKFTRLSRYMSVGLTVQEDVTAKIANFLVEKVSPDCMVMIEAIHTCEVARGVENPYSPFVTVEARGIFRDKEGPRLEFFSAVK